MAGDERGGEVPVQGERNGAAGRRRLETYMTSCALTLAYSLLCTPLLTNIPVSLYLYFLIVMLIKQ